MTRSIDSGEAIRWPTAARSAVRGLDDAAEGDVARQRFRAAAQDAGVAALDRQRRGLDGHVRPALVDHREDADRHAHAADADAARLLAQVDDRADRIGHRGDLLAALGDGGDRRAVELEAIDERLGQAGFARRGHVAGIGRLEFARVVAQTPRQRAQGGIARRHR